MWFHLWTLQISLFYLPLDKVELEDLDDFIDLDDEFDWSFAEIIDFLELTEDFYETTVVLSSSLSS